LTIHAKLINLSTMAVKLSDVAKEANISVATASMALAGKGRISPEVIKRIVKAAERLGYIKRNRQPNLAKGRSRSFAFLHMTYFPITWMFERLFILQTEKTLLEKSYFPCLIDIDNLKSTDEILKAIVDSQMLGVFSIHYGNEPLFKELTRIGIPVVLINNSSYQDKFNSVLVDDFQGAYEGTMRLIRSGHRRIGYILFEKAEFDHVNLPHCMSDRFVGFKKALDENEIPFRPELKISVESKDFEKTLKRIRTAFSVHNPPTAFFVQDDHLAGCVYKAIEEIGMKVPQDISLIAAGDVLDYSLPFIPQISTMRIDSNMMADLACNLMVDRLKRPTSKISVLKVKQQFKDRKSISHPPE
jgi:DNA-binding LacI/PurR family transcriptional regulator